MDGKNKDRTLIREKLRFFFHSFDNSLLSMKAGYEYLSFLKHHQSYKVKRKKNYRFKLPEKLVYFFPSREILKSYKNNGF